MSMMEKEIKNRNFFFIIYDLLPVPFKKQLRSTNFIEIKVDILYVCFLGTKIIGFGKYCTKIAHCRKCREVRSGISLRSSFLCLLVFETFSH